MGRQTDRQADRQTGRQVHSQNDRQTGRQLQGLLMAGISYQDMRQEQCAAETGAVDKQMDG